MQAPDNLDKKIETLEREIKSGKRTLFVLCALMILLQLLYTTAGIQQEKATGQKQFQVIPYSAPLYSLHLLSNDATQPEETKDLHK